jgi:hypothetical protein
MITLSDMNDIDLQTLCIDLLVIQFAIVHTAVWHVVCMYTMLMAFWYDNYCKCIVLNQKRSKVTGLMGQQGFKVNFTH